MLLEVMACGMPVRALDCGAVHEVMVDKKMGFIVDSIDEMAEAINTAA